MASTALDFIQESLERLRIYGVGKVLTSYDLNRALAILNKMMDQWSTQPYACIANLEQNFVLTPGKQAYTIGLSGGADVPQSRPIKLREGYGVAYLLDSNGVRYEVEVVNQERWNQISIITNTSQIPYILFYDAQYPLAIINIYPSPILAYTLFFDSRVKLASFPTLTTQVSLPEGYEDAISLQLTVRMKPFFKGAILDPDIAEMAREAFANVKRSNMRPVIAEFEGEILPRGSPTYNIYNDTGGTS